MPGAARLGDSSTGHGGFPPRSNIGASGNVLINGIPAHRVGDGWPVHCNSAPSCHAGSTSGGSGTVFVNSQPLARIGDSISCGDSIASGSSNVIVG